MIVMTRKAPSSAQSTRFDSEATPIGDQLVIHGYRPITDRERLEQQARMPMTPKRPCIQRPCDIGLFDEVRRKQLDLF